MDSLLPLPHHADLFLVPSRLSASERIPHFKPNYTLRLRHPLLSRIEHCTSTSHLKQLHSLLITAGLAHHPFAHSRLLAFAALSLHGDLQYALKLFQYTPHLPNLFSWNTMIRAFSRSNRPDICIHFYVAMLEFGFAPDRYTFPFLLKACAHDAMVSEGLQVHGHVVKSGLLADCFVGNSLLRMYAEFGLIESAEKLFEKMPKRDEVAWTTMIGGYVDAGRAAEALGLFCAHDWRKTRLDCVTLGTVLKASSKLKDLRVGEEIHRYIEEEEIEMSLILGNSLMKMYTECGRMENARLVFDRMPDRDLCSWNILINGYLEHGDLEEGIELFFEMNMKNIQVDEATVLGVIAACQELEHGEAVHRIVRQMELASSLSVCSALICMYSRIGCVSLGRQVFDEMSERDVVVWNSMVSAYAQCGSMELAHHIFYQMPEKDIISWSTMILGYVRKGLPIVAIDMYKDLVTNGGIEPDKITISNVLAACSDAGSLEEGESVHLFLLKNKIPIDASLGTALIDMYAKCGCLEMAVKVFEGIPQKDVLVWTALISGLAVHGHGHEALVAFEQMQSERCGFLKPNSITYLSVLSACAHAGLVHEGWKIYHSMTSDHDIYPNGQHNGCMVDLLARAGMLNEAVQFVKGLGIDADIRSWGALLNASRIHRNIVVGEVAAANILMLEPMHEGAHVLMSNIYAEAGMWHDSKVARRRMKEEGIRKEVGRSWIEVNGVRHEFTSGEGLP